MKSLPRLLGLLLGLATPLSAAYIDDTLHYQGRVSVQGVNFNGPGQFKFALVDAGTPFGSPATATATVDGDAVGAVTVDQTGSNYTEPPVITFSGPGSGATAVANLDLGIVISITVTNGGSGYATAPVVTIAPPPAGLIHSSYWSNDGTSTSGDEPQAAVEIPVVNGLYSVQLGGTAPGMTRFDSEIFAQKLHLRVWFNDGVHGFQQLTPDQPLASAPYALQARLAESVAPGAIGSAQLASGAAAANLGASGQSGVASGGVILSGTENPALAAAGYVKLPAIKFDEIWAAGSSAGPAAVVLPKPVCLWTGTAMFVWNGGATGGGLYNPATNSWILLAGNAPGAPAGQRDYACAVWTGTEVILWGGNASTNLGYQKNNEGGRYNPATNTWTEIPGSMPNTPSARSGHSAVWTGSKMIVWGGLTNSGETNTGATYDPLANAGAGSWTPTLVVGSTPSARSLHSAVWNGADMIIWGGEVTGGIATNSIGIMSGFSGGWVGNPGGVILGTPPEARAHHSTLWTGSDMIVWGGDNASIGAIYNNGYRLTTEFIEGANRQIWYPLATANAPSPRFGHSAVWTGTEMIVWGGTGSSGGRYDTAAGRWTPISDSPPEAVRAYHGAVWTGSQMIVWGNSPYPAPWSWTPERRMFLYQRP